MNKKLLTIDDKIEILYDFGKIVDRNPEYQKPYDLMVYGFSKKYHINEQYLRDTLDYLRKVDK